MQLHDSKSFSENVKSQKFNLDISEASNTVNSTQINSSMISSPILSFLVYEKKLKSFGRHRKIFYILELALLDQYLRLFKLGENNNVSKSIKTKNSKNDNDEIEESFIKSSSSSNDNSKSNFSGYSQQHVQPVFNCRYSDLIIEFHKKSTIEMLLKDAKSCNSQQLFRLIFQTDKEYNTFCKKQKEIDKQDKNTKALHEKSQISDKNSQNLINNIDNFVSNKNSIHIERNSNKFLSSVRELFKNKVNRKSFDFKNNLNMNIDQKDDGNKESRRISQSTNLNNVSKSSISDYKTKPSKNIITMHDKDFVSCQSTLKSFRKAKFLPNESVMQYYSNTSGHRRGSNKYYSNGCIIFTNYRLMYSPFFDSNKNLDFNYSNDLFIVPALEVPFLAIEDFQKLNSIVSSTGNNNSLNSPEINFDLESSGFINSNLATTSPNIRHRSSSFGLKSNNLCLLINCKDLRSLEFNINMVNNQNRSSIIETLQQLVYPKLSDLVFAFCMIRTKHLNQQRRYFSDISLSSTASDNCVNVSGNSNKITNNNRIYSSSLDQSIRYDKNNYSINKNFLTFPKLNSNELKNKQKSSPNSVSFPIKESTFNTNRTPNELIFNCEVSKIDTSFNKAFENNIKNLEKRNSLLYGEYLRLKLFSCSKNTFENNKLRLSYINANFKLCYSYPELLIVPSQATDKDLLKSAEFRSRSRFPVIVQQKNPLCKKKERFENCILTISRSSQPRQGFSGNRSKYDEKLVESIRIASFMHKDINSSLLIIDARSRLTAYGNRARGKGYETSSNYEKCNVVFMNIENIHVVRESWNGLKSLIEEMDDPKQLSRLENTKWFSHIRQILMGSRRIVHAIENEKTSVLVHCSDGQDRTSQLVSLAEILLDPYYRTIEGFCILIQKEQLGFGHKFAERLGTQGYDGIRNISKQRNERSPIFQQWLDTVYQLLCQFPTFFEFDQTLLLFLAKHINSGRFGTFFYKNEKERRIFENEKKTLSIQDYIRQKVIIKNKFKNCLYQKKLSKKGKCCSHVLWPSCNICDIQFWHLCYCPQNEADANIRTFSNYSKNEENYFTKQHNQELTDYDNNFNSSSFKNSKLVNNIIKNKEQSKKALTNNYLTTDIAKNNNQSKRRVSQDIDTFRNQETKAIFRSGRCFEKEKTNESRQKNFSNLVNSKIINRRHSIQFYI